jgi:Haemolysin-III related
MAEAEEQRSTAAARKTTSLQRKTLTHKEMPAHLTFNPYITTGYRIHGMTPIEAIASVFSHFHNETFNVASHLLVFLATIYFMVDSALIHPVMDEKHFASVFFSLICGAVCFLGSTIYHTLMPSTLDALSYRKLLLADMMGIWAVNLGLGVCVSYLMLPCAPTLLKLGVTALPACLTLFWMFVVAKTPAQRMQGFGFQLIARWGFVLICYFGRYTHWSSSEAMTHCMLEILTAVGAAINVFRFPERWLPPGSVDLLPLNSHTLMHFCVGISFLWRYYEALQQAIAVHDNEELLLCSRTA